MKSGPLKRLRVTNFQCHAELDLDDLSPGVNVFVGRSGQGKSAGVVRPLRLLYANRPVGEDYRKWDTDKTTVESWWDDLEGETYVARVRSNKDNYYDTGHPTKHRGFGMGSPPEEVILALNLADLNLASQHDSLYLLSAKPLEVARELNGIIGLDDIDRAYEYVNGLKWKEAQEKKTQKALRDKYELDLAQYNRLEELESRLMVIEELESRAKEAHTKASWLSSTATALRQAQAEVSKYKDLPKLIKSYGEVRAKFKELSSLEDRIESLQDISDRLRQAEADHKVFATLDKAKHKVTVLLAKKVEILNATLERINSLENLSARLKKAGAEKLQASKELKAAEKEFNTLVKDRCPICGRSGK